MDFAAMQFWYNVVMGVVNIALWLFIWNSNRNRVTREKIEKLEEEFDQEIKDIRKEQADMDKRISQAIGHNELEPLHRRMNGIDTKMGEMAGEFRGVKHLLELIHEHMLTGGGKS